MNAMPFFNLPPTFRIAEAFELDPKGIPLGGACLPAKRFGSEHSGAGNALLVDAATYLAFLFHIKKKLCNIH
jgi:hypothetical protein